MFYCVVSIYHAGGLVSRDMRVVHSSVKPKDCEVELAYKVVVYKYFDDENQAADYLKKLGI